MQTGCLLLVASTRWCGFGNFSACTFHRPGGTGRISGGDGVMPLQKGIAAKPMPRLKRACLYDVSLQPPWEILFHNSHRLNSYNRVEGIQANDTTLI
jgi:hypothetical protein